MVVVKIEAASSLILVTTGLWISYMGVQNFSVTESNWNSNIINSNELVPAVTVAS